MWADSKEPRIGVPAARLGVHPETVRTERLVVEPMSADVVRSILRKDWSRTRRLLGTEFPLEWRADGWGWLESQADKGEHDDRFIVWGTRLAFTTAADEVDNGAEVVAEVGFHGPPDSDGWVEIGYRVVASHRREGLAEEAARAVIDWAVVHGVSGVKASVSPDNAASIGLLHKLGFTESDRYLHDTLGDQLILVRRALAR